jgi:signal transduction histidine kinase
LIEGLLTLARIEARREVVHIEEVDAGTLARESVGILQAAAATKGLRLDLTLPEQPQVIDTDATKVRQILINLLSNAVKFTERGDVALTVSSANGATVSFAVRDTGIGIPAHQHATIFEAFRQADQSRTRRLGGAGLGLGVSRARAPAAATLPCDSLGGRRRLLSLPASVAAAVWRRDDA